MEMPRPLQTVACLHQPDPPSNKSTSSASLARVQGAAVVVFFQQNPPLKRRLVLMAGCVYIWSGATGNVNQGPQKPLGFIGSLGGRCLCSALSARRHSALCLLDTGAQRLTGLHLVGSSQVTDFFFTLDWFSAEAPYWPDAKLAPAFFSTVLFCLHTAGTRHSRALV